MSNQALSQDEIDALFTGGPATTVDPAPAPRPTAEVRLYDFRRPSRVSKERQRTLEGMYGVLARSLESWMAGRVRAKLDVSLVSVEQLTFGEFALSLADPCAAFVFDVGEPGGPQAVIDVGQHLAFYTVERFLGSGIDPFVPDRALTVVERRIVQILAERVAGQLGDIWTGHAQLDLNLARFESVPDMVQAANREDPMLVVNIEVGFKGQASSLLLCLPFSVLDGFFAAGVSQRIRAPGRDEAAGVDRTSVESSVRRAPLPVSVRLPRFDLAMKDILGLKPGTVLLTGIRRDSPVEVLVGDRSRFTGRIGTMNNTLAVEIEGALDNDGGNADA